MSTELKNIPSHIAKFIGGLDLKPISEVMQLPAEERFNYAVLGDQLELAGILYKGFSLLGLKEELGHGQYLAELAKKNMEPTSAWRAQNLSKLSMRVNASNFAALQNLTPTKLAMTVKWDDSELKSFFSGSEVRGITYDDAVVIPTREMESRLKQAHLSNNELEQHLNKERLAKEKAEEQLRLIKKTHNNLTAFKYPPSIERVRIESSVLSAQAIQFIDDMEQMAVELMSASDLSSNKEKQQAEFSAGASSLYLNLKAIQAKSTYLLGWFAQTIGNDYLPEKPEDVPVMDEPEAERIQALHVYMLAEERVKKLARESTQKPKRKNKKKA